MCLKIKFDPNRIKFRMLIEKNALISKLSRHVGHVTQVFVLHELQSFRATRWSAQREPSEYMRARSASPPRTCERAARAVQVHASAQREPFKYRRARSASRSIVTENT